MDVFKYQPLIFPSMIEISCFIILSIESSFEELSSQYKKYLYYMDGYNFYPITNAN